MKDEFKGNNFIQCLWLYLQYKHNFSVPSKEYLFLVEGNPFLTNRDCQHMLPLSGTKFKESVKYKEINQI